MYGTHKCLFWSKETTKRGSSMVIVRVQSSFFLQQALKLVFQLDLYLEWWILNKRQVSFFWVRWCYLFNKIYSLQSFIMLPRRSFKSHLLICKSHKLKARLILLKIQIHTLKKRSMIIAEYFANIKHLADSFDTNNN